MHSVTRFWLDFLAQKWPASRSLDANHSFRSLGMPMQTVPSLKEVAIRIRSSNNMQLL